METGNTLRGFAQNDEKFILLARLKMTLLLLSWSNTKRMLYRMASERPATFFFLQSLDFSWKFSVKPCATRTASKNNPTNSKHIHLLLR
jgi:hypothetical protein